MFFLQKNWERVHNVVKNVQFYCIFIKQCFFCKFFRVGPLLYLTPLPPIWFHDIVKKIKWDTPYLCFNSFLLIVLKIFQGVLFLYLPPHTLCWTMFCCDSRLMSQREGYVGPRRTITSREMATLHSTAKLYYVRQSRDKFNKMLQFFTFFGLSLELALAGIELTTSRLWLHCLNN